MKELSIEEKAARYDEAIGMINKCTTDKYGCILGVKPTDIFPELVEIEDDRIRKELIDYFSASHATDTFRGIPWDRVVSWLEKQGVYEPTYVIPRFRVGDVIRIKGSNAEYLITEISDGYYRGAGWCLDIIEGDKSNDYELICSIRPQQS